jgi:hypothetical protein
LLLQEVKGVYRQEVVIWRMPIEEAFLEIMLVLSIQGVMPCQGGSKQLEQMSQLRYKEAMLLDRLSRPLLSALSCFFV